MYQLDGSQSNKHYVKRQTNGALINFTAEHLLKNVLV